MPFGEISHIYNTRLAQELSCLAEKENKGAEFHKAAFAAYFVEGKNLADLKVLEDIAASVGLEKAAAREVVEQRTFQQQVDADWERAAENRITAVPTFIIKQERMVGAQPYEKLKRMMCRHNVRPKQAPNKADPSDQK